MSQEPPQDYLDRVGSLIGSIADNVDRLLALAQEYEANAVDFSTAQSYVTIMPINCAPEREEDPFIVEGSD